MNAPASTCRTPPATIVAAVDGGPLDEEVRESARMRANALGARVILLRSPSRANATAAILALAKDTLAQLIVVGPGGAAIHVAKAASCPVLIPRPSRGGSVVAATDFTDARIPAMVHAAREARARGRRLCLFHAVNPEFVRDFAGPDGDLHHRMARAQVDCVRQLLAGYGNQLDPQADVRAVFGDPSRELEALLRELPAELVVVAARRRPWLASLLHRCVVDELVSKAPCSVLVVPKSRRSPARWLGDLLLN